MNPQSYSYYSAVNVGLLTHSRHLPSSLAWNLTHTRTRDFTVRYGISPAFVFLAVHRVNQRSVPFGLLGSPTPCQTADRWQRFRVDCILPSS